MEAEPPSLPLGREFFSRTTADVARDLLGVWLIRSSPGGLTGGPIVETEAYAGPEDKASHARAGVTPRTAPMFGTVGHAYVYLVYGMHHCLNVVAYDSTLAKAGAVLIRALEPRLGFDAADSRLCAGPAKLCRALDVTRGLDGHDLTIPDGLWLAHAPWPPVHRVEVGRRIGVDYAGAWSEKPWRFWQAGNPSVSR